MKNNSEKKSIMSVETHLSLQYSIVRILAESNGTAAILLKILQTVCEYNGWGIGEIWFIDGDTGVLRLDSMWHHPSWDARKFEEVSRGITFKPGQGLPGRAWESGRPEWITDVVGDPNFLRESIASEMGLHTAFAFPIKKSGKVMGVFAFFSRDIVTPDDALLEMFAAIGDQVGGFIKRKQAEEALRKMEAEVERAHRLESIGILAGGIAHDFNNLLTVISGGISLSKMHVPPSGKAYKWLGEAENACKQANEVTNRLIMFSEGGEPLKEEASLSEIINERVDALLSGSEIKPEISLPEDLYPVEIDRGQIVQAFSNLMINAREAMPEGGVLKVGAKNIHVSINDNIPLSEGNYVKITLSDTGKGIPKENISSIFDPYFTTKEMGSVKGTGLGLSVCYSIIKKHGVFIDVDSRVGTGTTFHIYLPAYEKQKDKRTAAAAKRILVMDDEAIVRKVASGILEESGFEVETARDGLEAVDSYMKAKESGRPFDAVLLDLSVAEGVGGEFAIRKLQAIDPSVKGIVMSGYAKDHVMTEYENYGFAAAIAKPFDFKRLKEVVEGVLRK